LNFLKNKINMIENKTDSQVEVNSENALNEMLEAQAELDGVSKEELQAKMMRQMFTPTERKIMSMSEEQIQNEYLLIQDKKSDLSRVERDLVEVVFTKMNGRESK